MSEKRDDSNHEPTTPQNEQPSKILFTAQQQEVINAIVQERLGQERRKNDEKVRSLEAELEEARKGEDEVTAQTRKLQDAERKVVELQTAILHSNKRNAIRDGAEGLNFMKLEMLEKLIDDRIAYDPERDDFYATNEDGTVFRNDGGQTGSIREFLVRFAEEHDFLVQGEMKSGAGASENSKNGVHAAIRTKADFKSTEEKVAFVKKHGYQNFAALPVK